MCMQPKANDSDEGVEEEEKKGLSFSIKKRSVVNLHLFNIYQDSSSFVSSTPSFNLKNVKAN